MLNKDIELLIKKIEDEAKLIKSDGSNDEFQELLREKVLLENNLKKAEQENQKLKDEIAEYKKENLQLQKDLERILGILRSKALPVTDVIKTVDKDIIETDEESLKNRRKGLRDILRENSQNF